MTNRRQRRAGSRAQRLARTIRCPDCNSETTVVKVAPRHFQGVIRHDDSCPWLAAFENAGGLRIRLGYETNPDNEGEQES